MALLVVDEALLDVEQAWTSIFYLKSFDMDSVQVGKAVFGKEIYTTLDLIGLILNHITDIFMTEEGRG